MDGKPLAGLGLSRGRQWGESGPVLEDSVLEGSNRTMSQLLLGQSELNPDTRATSKPRTLQYPSAPDPCPGSLKLNLLSVYESSLS